MALSSIKAKIFTFFSKKAEIIAMNSKFWENVRDHIKDTRDGQKWLAEASGVGRTAINGGIAKLSKPETKGNTIVNSPSADNAFAIAKVLKTTVEQLVDGARGAEYVRQLYAAKGLFWEPPGRIADIVAVLDAVDDATLDTVRIMLLPLREKKGDVASDLATG